VSEDDSSTGIVDVTGLGVISRHTSDSVTGEIVLLSSIGLRMGMRTFIVFGFPWPDAEATLWAATWQRVLPRIALFLHRSPDLVMALQRLSILWFVSHMTSHASKVAEHLLVNPARCCSGGVDGLDCSPGG
jgi:hypothetical protein